MFSSPGCNGGEPMVRFGRNMCCLLDWGCLPCAVHPYHGLRSMEPSIKTTVVSGIFSLARIGVPWP